MILANCVIKTNISYQKKLNKNMETQAKIYRQPSNQTKNIHFMMT